MLIHITPRLAPRALAEYTHCIITLLCLPTDMTTGRRLCCCVAPHIKFIIRHLWRGHEFASLAACVAIANERVLLA